MLDNDLGLETVPDGADGYQYALSRNFFPLSFEFQGDRTKFAAAIATRYLGGLRFTRAYSNDSFRTCHCGSAVPHEGIELILMLTEAGHIAFSAENDSVECRAGSLILLDTSRDFRTEQFGEAKALALAIPAQLLGRQFLSMREYCMRNLECGEGVQAILSSTLRTVWNQLYTLQTNDADGILSVLLRLIYMSFDSPLLTTPSGTVKEKTQVRRIYQVIERNLTDSCLSAAFIAREVGISKSHLFSLMKQHGNSLNEVIIRRRLERCRQDLLDPNYGERSITEIAFRWGFEDLPHFSRRFKARFGHPPSGYRTGHSVSSVGRHGCTPSNS